MRSFLRCHLSPANLLLAFTFWCSSPRPSWAQSAAIRLAIESTGPAGVQVSWPSAPTDFILEATSTLGTGKAWHTITGVTQLHTNRWSLTLPPAETLQFYRLRQIQLTPSFQVTRHTPLDGADDVGVTYRPQIFFSQPVDPTSLTADNFFAAAAGVRLEANIVPANDGSFAWLFFKKSMPGNTQVRVTINGATIRAADQKTLLDPTGNGFPGSATAFEFTTVSQIAVAGTSLTGMVVDPGPDLIPRTADDALPGPDGLINPTFGTGAYFFEETADSLEKLRPPGPRSALQN